MPWKNIITEKFSIDYPVIQAPMLGVSTPEMAAAVSNEGGLGSLAIGGLSPETSVQLIRKTKSLTNKPFAVNLFAHDIPAYTEAELEPMRQFLLAMVRKKGYQLDEAMLSNFKHYNHRDQINLLVEENISIVSFTFGCLDKKSIHTLKNNNCVLMGTATSVGEALFLQAQGIDMVVAQGLEAGGHRGTFINDENPPQTGLFSLLPQVVDQASLPCIAAGGINNSRTMRACFDLGAQAVQIGTTFINTNESKAIKPYRARVTSAKETDTSLTRAFSGRWARGFRNELMNQVEQSGIPIPPYPWQNSLTTKIRTMSQDAGDDDFTTLWAGQSAGAVAAGDSLPSKTVFLNLIREYEAAYLT